MAKKQDSDKIIADQAKEIAALKAKVSAKEAKASKDLQNQVNWASQLVDIQKEYVDSLEAGRSAASKINDINKEISEYQKFIVDNAKSLTKEEKAYLGSQIKSMRMQKDQAKLMLKNFTTQAKISKLEEKALPHRQKINEALKKRNELEEKYKGSVSKSLGFIDDIDNKISSIPVVGDFLSKAIGLDKVKENLEDKFTGYLTNALDPSIKKQEEASQAALKGYDDQIAGLRGIEEAAGEVTGGVGGIAEGAAGAGKGFFGAIPGVMGLNAALSAGPLVVITAIALAIEGIKKLLEMDQEVTDLARGLGVSKDNARELHANLAQVAMDTKVAGANVKELTSAYMELTAITGQTTVANKQMLESQVLLKKQYGMTAEEASDFQQMSIGTGKSSEQNLATIKQMTEGYNTMTGDSMSFKEITKQVNKASKETLASYKGDVKALTLAAIQAKKIGMTLEDTQKVADNLLDIESSVAAETKASVLLGKSVNMNKARELALMGDTAGAAAEAVKQAGSYDDLLKMNVFQRRAIAEAAGMTVEDLMKAGELEKMSKALGGAKLKDMKDLTAEQIEQLKAQGDISEEKAKELVVQQQQVSAQEKMTAITDKLQALFIQIMEPLLEMLDPFFQMIDYIFPAIVAGIKFFMAPMMGFFDLIGGIVKIFQGDMTEGIKQLGTGIIELIFSPFKLVWDLITGFFPGLKDMVGDAIAWLGNALSDFLPDWLLDMMGAGSGGGAAEGGGGEAAASGEEPEKMNDGVIKGGSVVKSPKGTFKLADEDTIIAGTELGTPGKGGEVLDALKDMLSKVKGISEDDISALEDRFDEMEDAFAELDIQDILDFASLGKEDLVKAGDSLSKGIGSIASIGRKVDLSELEETFEDIEDAFDEIDLDELLDFASLGEQNLEKAGTSLADGLNSVSDLGKKADLSKLEDTFEDIEDAFDELDMGDLVAFGDLANKDLSGVGKSLAAGISSLTAIKDEANLSGVEDAFDELEDALGELNVKDLVDFMNLGAAPLGNVGENIANGIKSLADHVTPEMASQLEGIEDVFDQLEDVIAELDLEELDEFMDMDFTNMATIGQQLSTGIAAMAGIKAADLSSLEDTFDVLEDAIDELDMDELQEFMELDLGKLGQIAQGGGGGGGAAAAPSGGGNGEVVALLKQLVASVSQPVTIKLGNKVIDEIEKMGTMKRTYNTKMDKAPGSMG